MVNDIFWQNRYFHIKVIIRPDIYRLNINFMLKSMKNYMNGIIISNHKIHIMKHFIWIRLYETYYMKLIICSCHYQIIFDIFISFMSFLMDLSLMLILRRYISGLIMTDI